jgi:PhnB protein
MPKRSLSTRLDDQVQAILAGGSPAAEPELAELARVARGLRHLPSEQFRERLKAELQGRKVMIQTPTHIRQGYRTVTNYLATPHAAELIEFVKQVFGAEEVFRGTGHGGGIHAEVRIGDSMVKISGGPAFRREPRTASLHVYVRDVDDVYRRAIEAGAESLGEPADMPYGERGAGFKDVAGNTWYPATALGERHVPEGADDLMPYFHPHSAVAMIEFLARAFGAEELARHAGPDGRILHAQVRIGDSVLEMGEAHGPYQPMPHSLYVYVPDADAAYQRALEAGATSLLPPADQPYGDRMGGVLDPFGNEWFLATPKA